MSHGEKEKVEEGTRVAKFREEEGWWLRLLP